MSTGARRITSASDLVQRTFTWAFLLLLLVIMLFPFYVVIINAFKSPSDYALTGPMTIAPTIYLDGIIRFWNRVNFGEKLVNSFVISLSVSVFAIVLSLLSSFAIGIGRIRGRIWFLILFVVANTLPHESLAYPLFYLANFFGIYDSRIAVILVFTVIQSAFGTYLLSNVFASFPREALEAANLDGASKGTILFRIVAPMSRPTISVLFTFFFIWTWNEFFLPLILLVSNRNQTVPIAIAVTQGQHNMDVTTASASALLGVLPCLVFFAIFQRNLVRGINAGAVK